MAMLERSKDRNTQNQRKPSGSKTIFKTVIVGWQHYVYSLKKYVLQKSTTKRENTAGPRPVHINKCFNQRQVLTEVTQIFFPNGKNYKGKVNTMDSFLGNYKGEVVQFEQLQHYGKDKPHLYVFTKQKIPTLETSSSSDSDSVELPDPEIYAPEVQIRNNQLASTPAHNMSPLAGPSMSPLAGPSMSPLAGPSMSSLAGQSNLQYTHRISPTQYFQPQSATPTQQSTSMTPASTPEDSLGARWINLDTPTMSVSRTFLQRSLAAEDQTRRCTLYVDRQKNAVIIPCGHTFCMECATQVEALEQPCPMCRQEIQDVNPFYG